MEHINFNQWSILILTFVILVLFFSYPVYAVSESLKSLSSDSALSIDGKQAGIVSANGNIFTIVDTDASDGDLSIHVGIKKSSGMSNASLNGTFIMCEYGTDPNRWTGRIELTFDGNGNGTSVQIDDSNGDANSGSVTYSVGSDGTLSIDGTPSRKAMPWIPLLLFDE